MQALQQRVPGPSLSQKLLSSDYTLYVLETEHTVTFSCGGDSNMPWALTSSTSKDLTSTSSQPLTPTAMLLTLSLPLALSPPESQFQTPHLLITTFPFPSSPPTPASFTDTCC